MVETLIRKAVLTDAQDILDLVNGLAQDQVMLPRSPASVVENIRDFQVAQVEGAFAGCSALAVIWSDIAEVRSIAVSPEHQGLGLGHRMLERLIGEALQLGVQRVMAFTYIPDFFVRRGFHLVKHTDLPHKVFNDCLNCPKFHCCDEVAVLRELYGSNSSPRREPASLPTPGVPLPRIANPTSERVAVAGDPPPGKAGRAG